MFIDCCLSLKKTAKQFFYLPSVQTRVHTCNCQQDTVEHQRTLPPSLPLRSLPHWKTAPLLPPLQESPVSRLLVLEHGQGSVRPPEAQTVPNEGGKQEVRVDSETRLQPLDRKHTVILAYFIFTRGLEFRMWHWIIQFHLLSKCNIPE